MTRALTLVALASLLLTHVAPVAAQRPTDGLLSTADGQTRFPIGWYHLPDDDAELRALTDAGVNLFLCRSRDDLDRVHALGAMGWVPLPLDQGPTEALRAKVRSVYGHPALAVWEGPDEIVWNFTAFSGLAKTAGFTRDDWWDQKPAAVAYARARAAEVMPNIRAAIDTIRAVDGGAHPVWINEAGSSDVSYARQYMDHIDITGCDYYSVRPTFVDLERVGRMTDRWRWAGRGKPVWMVLQAFSWHTAKPETYTEPRYPTFAETRFMAWDAIVHGARGVCYWGSTLIEDEAFSGSLHAMVAELAALQPLLVAPEVDGLSVRLIEAPEDDAPVRGVRLSVRTDGQDWLVVLVNEDEVRHLAVEVTGLEALQGHTLERLYGDETVAVDGRGELLTRLQAYETKVFATGRGWEAAARAGRDYGAPAD